ncbi:MAG: alpha/beta hydrolase [Pseudomonadota bacterium]
MSNHNAVLPSTDLPTPPFASARADSTNGTQLSTLSRRSLLGTASVALGALSLAKPGKLLAQQVPTDAELDAKYFAGFEIKKLTANNATIHTVVGGNGPPVLLLHGAPLSHLSWAEVAVNLAKDFTVVCPDLRGYGWSSKPDGGENHINYSKRTMAQDQVEVMQQLGFSNFALVGHDRGGRVARRLTLDNPDKVKNLTVLDIVPAHYLYSHVTRQFVDAYFHWFLFLRPAPFPENIMASTGQYISGGPGEIGEAFSRVYKDPAAIHAMCEDYRASAGMDIGIDEADIAAGKKIECPLNVLWGDNAAMGRQYDVMGIWKMEATNVEGKAMPGGHNFLMENPGPTYTELKRFLS